MTAQQSAAHLTSDAYSAVLSDCMSPDQMRKSILRLAWPVIAEMALTTVTQIVDTAMVGRLGAPAVAAVAMSFQPLWIAIGVFTGLGVGTTALVARLCGSQERSEADKVLTQSLIVSAVLGMALFLLTYPNAKYIVQFMGGEPEVVSLGASYLRVLLPGLSFMLVHMVASAALRGAGDTRTPMKINVMINLLNVCGNALLIFGLFGFPALGVVGAGIATSVSRIFGCCLMLCLLASGNKAINLNLETVKRLEFTYIPRVIKVGIPAALERLAISGGQLIYARSIVLLGTIPYAAHAISINAEAISYMPGYGFAMAATTLVGQNMGAGKPDVAERSVWETLRIGSAIMGFMGVLFFLFPEFFMRIYTNELEVIALGRVTLRTMGIAQIPLAVGFIIPGALRGAGDTRSVLYSTIIGMWGVRLGVTYILVYWFQMGLLGAWLAMAADWFLRSVYVLARFKSGSWKHMAV